MDSTETVWTIGTTNTSMEEEEEPPMLTRRTDTITSSTQYFNLMDVQPRNNHRYDRALPYLSIKNISTQVLRRHHGADG